MSAGCCVLHSGVDESAPPILGWTRRQRRWSRLQKMMLAEVRQFVSQISPSGSLVLIGVAVCQSTLLLVVFERSCAGRLRGCDLGTYANNDAGRGALECCAVLGKNLCAVLR